MTIKKMFITAISKPQQIVTNFTF
uniref:Uncharacterized protein n=1 Tax=Arundo donax TaxID=35708 RepID=A0A0A8Z4J0_ARUDO